MLNDINVKEILLWQILSNCDQNFPFSYREHQDPQEDLDLQTG